MTRKCFASTYACLTVLVLAWPGVASPSGEPSELPLPAKTVWSVDSFKLAVMNERDFIAAGSAEELAFIGLINQERKSRGLSELVFDSQLTAIARSNSRMLRDLNYFSHESSVTGLRTPLDRFKICVAQQLDYVCLGENLYWATITDIKVGHQSFMKSPTHRDNILFPRFEKVGVGIVKSKGEFWVTQLFASYTDPMRRIVKTK